MVVVVPVTHAPPLQTAQAIEIPLSTKLRLGLDSDRSWIVLNESNAFRWPGPDLRPAVNGDLSSVVFGLLPPRLFEVVLERFKAFETASRASKVQKTE